MNRSDMIQATAAKAQVEEKAVERVMQAFLDALTEALAGGESITLPRFGRFEPRLRRAVTKTNPRTGEPMVVAERLSVGFKASDALKDEVNQAKA